jgi:FlaA1/EpsC-like NDP-sugar epimerase
MTHFLDQKRILITGSCGALGSVLTQQLLEEHEPTEVSVIDNKED